MTENQKLDKKANDVVTACMLIMLIFLIFIIGSLAYKANKTYNTNKYILIQSDSPNMAGFHPEIDLISNDTIFVNWYSNGVSKPFYDGEGNLIPDSAVNLLVDAQFVKLTKPEKDYIKKYFYFYK